MCDASCECQCDECQERYEAGWKLTAEKENLCLACGMPYDLTKNRLVEFQYVHFYDPCSSCKPLIQALLKAENMCATCRNPLIDGSCVKCLCTKESGCMCHDCKVQ